MEWFQLTALWSAVCFVAGGSGIAWLEFKYDTYGIVAEEPVWQILAMISVTCFLIGMVGLLVSSFGWAYSLV